MRTSDLIRMALKNLLSRRLRTVFNLLGVVIGCMVILLTFAATRGVADGLYALLDSSDAVKLARLWPTYDPSTQVAEDIGAVEGDMPESRREAIRKRLIADWRNANFEQRMLDSRFTAALRSNPHVVELMPNGSLAVEVEFEGGKNWFACEGVSNLDKGLSRRILAGKIPGPDEDDQILIGEYAAYKMGYRTIDDAKSLLGQKLQVRFRKDKSSNSTLLYLLTQGKNGLTLADQIALLNSVRALTEKLDETSLTPDQIELLKLRLSSLFKEPEDELPLAAEFVICGVVSCADEYTPSFVPNIRGQINADIAVHYRVLDLMAEKSGLSMYQYGATARVDHYASLKEVEADIVKLGGNVHSASWIISQLDEQFSLARWGIAGIGMFVLGIAAFSISNTMVISVLERTAELGIMKSLGARDRQVVGMLLWEGGAMGVAGASFAVVLAFALAAIGEVFIRRYVSYRIGETYGGSIFAFTSLDVIIVFASSAVLCILASVLPAIRASRLDPIKAIRSS